MNGENLNSVLLKTVRKLRRAESDYLDSKLHRRKMENG